MSSNETEGVTELPPDSAMDKGKVHDRPVAGRRAANVGASTRILTPGRA